MLTFEAYRVLVEQAPIMIWRAGTDKLCNYFNERWLTFTGRSLEQERGNGWAEGVHPDDFQRCLDYYVSHFDRRLPFEMEYRLLRHDKVYRWISDSGSPFFDEHGVFGGYIGSCIDVTVRVEAQAALEKTRQQEIEKLRRLLPVCSWCKKVRNDDGYWREIGLYLHTEKIGMPTHGICDECAARHFGGSA